MDKGQRRQKSYKGKSRTFEKVIKIHLETKKVCLTVTLLCFLLSLYILLYLKNVTIPLIWIVQLL